MPGTSAHHQKFARASDAVTLLERLGAVATITEYRVKEIIFSQGSHADVVYYLQRGRVKLTVVSKDGKEAVIAILPTGSFFGEGCLAGQNVHVTSAASLADCSVMSLKKEKVLATIRRDPDFAEFFITYLLQRKLRTEEDLVDQLFNSSEKRLARTLVLLAHFGRDEAPTEVIVPNVTQETLARMIGTTRSRVNFFMNKFRRLGFIDYNKGLRVHPSLLRIVLRD
jgi:CRP/FNR family transcriptional regulator, cyclic AMP receptor protein